jgi:DNA-binding XRE family transcriptional regulator
MALEKPAKLHVLLCIHVNFTYNYFVGAGTREKPPSSELAKRSGIALYSWRRSTGLNRETFARIANFSERTLATYERHRKLPAPVRPQIIEAIRLVRALMQIIPSEDLTKWLHTANPGFDGKKPWTLIKNGERDLLWEMIHQTRHGAFA